MVWFARQAIEKARQLRRLAVYEVSLVGKPANRRRFLLFKSEGGNSDMDRLTEDDALDLEERLNTPASKEEDVMSALEKAEGLSDKEKNAVRGAMRLLGSLKDNKVIAKVLQSLASIAGYGYAAPTKGTGDKDEEEEDKDKNTDTPVNKSDKFAIPEEIASLSKSAKPDEYEAMLKAARENPGVVALLLPIVKARDMEIERQAQVLKEMKEREEMAQIEKMVDEVNLPGTSREDQVKFLKALTPEQRDAWLNQMKAVAAAVDVANLTSEIGTSRKPDSDKDSPMAQLAKMVDEAIEKSEGKLTKGEAWDRVLSTPEGQKLYETYEAKVGR